MPQALLLEKPIRLERVDASDSPRNQELPSTVIAFGFPDDDANIIGYVIYYKVYYSSTQDPDYRVDERYFDENTYIGSSTEMQPGDIIPNQRGFLRIGEFGKSEFEEYDIKHNDSQAAVYIDFDPGGLGGVNSNQRGEPIIGYDYPVTEDNRVKVLARGFIDPTDTRKGTATYPGTKFRSFVKDWEYDFDNRGDRFNDGDLRRGYNLLGNQPGREIKSIERCGTPYFRDRSPSQPLRIGFVVHSYGRIKGTLRPITSKPVYFEYVDYSPVHDANRDRSSP